MTVPGADDDDDHDHDHAELPEHTHAVMPRDFVPPAFQHVAPHILAARATRRRTAAQQTPLARPRRGKTAVTDYNDFSNTGSTGRKRNNTAKPSPKATKRARSASKSKFKQAGHGHGGRR